MSTPHPLAAIRPCLPPVQRPMGSVRMTFFEVDFRSPSTADHLVVGQNETQEARNLWSRWHNVLPKSAFPRQFDHLTHSISILGIFQEKLSSKSLWICQKLQIRPLAARSTSAWAHHISHRLNKNLQYHRSWSMTLFSQIQSYPNSSPLFFQLFDPPPSLRRWHPGGHRLLRL